jgi:hypothetical protein
MNKNEVPIFATGPDKSIVLCHSDLDGCNALQVCYRWLKEKVGKTHTIEFKNMTYEHINPVAEEIFKEHEQYRYILIGDISVNEDLSKRLPPNCFIFDHHDTSKYLESHPQCYWKHGHCGSVVAWMALYPNQKPSPAFGRLMSICNQYDLWFGNPAGGPPQQAIDMNVLQRKYGYNRFFEKFYDGFEEFDDEDLRIIGKHWEDQKDAIEKTDKVEYGDDVLLLIMFDERLDPNYWCNKFIVDGKKAVLVLYPNSKRLSLRINKSLSGKFHGGFFLQKNIQNTNNSKGGHELAAGCSVAGMSEDDILGIGEVLKNELEKIS